MVKYPYFNLSSPAFVEDPYPFYRELRRNDPYYRSPFGFFALTRDRDVRALLSDNRFGRALGWTTPQGTPNPRYQRPAPMSTAGWMMFKNPPDHTRLRGLVVKAFTAKRIQAMRERVQQTVDIYLDRIAQGERADIATDFAQQIPSRVIFDLLGVPEEVRRRLVDSIGGFMNLIEPAPMSNADLDHADAQHAEVVDILRGVFARKRREPSDDLLSELVQVEEQGDRLSATELIDNVILLFLAGFDTTTGMIGNALLALMRHPEQLAKLRAEPALMPGAVEEFLRYDSSVQYANRTALEDVVLGELAIPRGTMVMGVLGSANRDEAVYEEAERFDVTRSGVRPASFGGGIHHCLGGQLARLEIEIAVGSMIRRFPKLRLEEQATPVWRKSMTLRALSSLPALLK